MKLLLDQFVRQSIAVGRSGLNNIDATFKLTAIDLGIGIVHRLYQTSVGRVDICRNYFVTVDVTVFKMILGWIWIDPYF